jgi:predicted PhzF superfamily epimerase YddE/YHI9
VAAQGTALGRAGGCFVQHEGDTIWIGGDVVARCIDGDAVLSAS